MLRLLFSDALYFHTNLQTLKSLGKYWDQLYRGYIKIVFLQFHRVWFVDKRLRLEEILRVKMMKDSSEMDILGR